MFHKHWHEQQHYKCSLWMWYSALIRTLSSSSIFKSVFLCFVLFFVTALNERYLSAFKHAFQIFCQLIFVLFRNWRFEFNLKITFIYTHYSIIWIETGALDEKRILTTDYASVGIDGKSIFFCQREKVKQLNKKNRK